MKRVVLALLCCGVCCGAPVAVRAVDDTDDASGMLKVSAAKTRPTGDAPSDPRSGEVVPASEEPTPPEQAASSEDDGVVAAAYPISRYAPLWERSPFQIESVAPPVESAGLSQRFALTGIAQIDGKPIVFLMERATQNRMMVKTDSDEGGVSLVQIDVQQKYTDSTATVRQGAEVGVVRFDAASASPMMPQPSIQPPHMIPPGIPQAANPMQGGQVPAVAPAVQIPGQLVPAQTVPGVVPPVPGPGAPQNGQVQGDAGQMPPPRVIRRRALIPAAP